MLSITIKFRNCFERESILESEKLNRLPLKSHKHQKKHSLMLFNNLVVIKIKLKTSQNSGLIKFV